jgi:hypothetical protein
MIIQITFSVAITVAVQPIFLRCVFSLFVLFQDQAILGFSTIDDEVIDEYMVAYVTPGSSAAACGMQASEENFFLWSTCIKY